MPVAVAYYLPEQYPRLLATAEDATDLEATWQQWYQVLQETKQRAATLGMHLIDVTVDLDELDAYCRRQGLANMSSTRAQYAASLLSEQQKRQQTPSVLRRPMKKKKQRKR